MKGKTRLRIILRIIQCTMSLKYSVFLTQDEPEYRFVLKNSLIPFIICNWHSRRVLSWRLSNTLESDFCVEALGESLTLYGTPEIFNSDQGSQFTSESFTSRLIAKNVKISMDGRGLAYDNIFIERLWRSVKYEDIYLCQYQNIPECKTGLGEYFRTYDVERQHQALDYKTPQEVYFEGMKNCVVSDRDREMLSTFKKSLKPV